MDEFKSNITDSFHPEIQEHPQDELDEELKRSAKKNHYKRGQTFKNHVNVVALMGLWSVVIAVMLCGAVYLFHMITPETYHFLKGEQLEQIRTFVVTAILSSSLTNYANRHIHNED